MFVSHDNNPILKIIDFGTGTRIKPGKTLSKQIGTPYYVAPEVLTKSYTEKCDVWSCGIILYMMLCGHPPFRGTTQKEILCNVRHQTLYFESKPSDNSDDLWKNTAIEALNSLWVNSTCSDTPLNAEVM
jgi:calcium-dependent protein kinase